MIQKKKNEINFKFIFAILMMHEALVGMDFKLANPTFPPGNKFQMISTEIDPAVTF